MEMPSKVCLANRGSARVLPSLVTPSKKEADPVNIFIRYLEVFLVL